MDILLKEAQPEGRVNQIIIEVKLGAARKEHVDQLQKYVDARKPGTFEALLSALRMSVSAVLV